MRRVVIVVCDGHRDDFVAPELCAHICAVAASGRRMRAHRGVFPSATRASVASFATGAWPASHGLAGNTLALDHGGGLVLFDAGAPEIIDAMSRARGRTLARPTTSARVVEALGDGHAALVVSGGSPGAARLHDPEHRGRVHHRAGSFGPGGAALETRAAMATKDAAGDRGATDLFRRTLEDDGRIAYAVLWLCEPDTTMHACPLGSDTHKQAIAVADARVGEVRATVERLRARGDDVLFMVGSDHGQETVAEAVPVEQLLIDAGLKDGPGSRELVVAPQGSSGLVFLHAEARDRMKALEAFFRDHAWCGELLAGDALAVAGQAHAHDLVLAFSMRKYAEPNAYGTAGVTDVVTTEDKPAKPQGFGSHGGLGAFERSPFLVVEGGGFAPGSEEWGTTSLVDIAPTALRHLGLDRRGVDGRPITPD